MEGAFAGCRLSFNPRYVPAPEQRGLFRHVAGLVTLLMVTTATAEISFPSLPHTHVSHKRMSSLQRAEQGLCASVKLLCTSIYLNGKRAVTALRMPVSRSNWIHPDLASGALLGPPCGQTSLEEPCSTLLGQGQRVQRAVPGDGIPLLQGRQSQWCSRITALPLASWVGSFTHPGSTPALSNVCSSFCGPLPAELSTSRSSSCQLMSVQSREPAQTLFCSPLAWPLGWLMRTVVVLESQEVPMPSGVQHTAHSPACPGGDDAPSHPYPQGLFCTSVSVQLGLKRWRWGRISGTLNVSLHGPVFCRILVQKSCEGELGGNNRLQHLQLQRDCPRAVPGLGLQPSLGQVPLKQGMVMLLPVL